MATDKSERRNRIVMALGIATIVLFSANLLTAIAKHFWPEHATMAMFSPRDNAEMERAPLAEYEFKVDVARFPHLKHRIVMRSPMHRAFFEDDCFDSDLESELDQELASMEQATRRLEQELSGNMHMKRLTSIWTSHFSN